MREKEGKDGKDASELAWELFEKTGNFTYYMLYKQLKK
ncbi:MAG TPA: YqzL family protein [Firmicutes bacterium]|nr:YqzL family protein [Bacillota bacterium]